ncbi:MAG: replicative DNA helicase [Pseudomonadota bacterium]|nr:replicative DNA helicase [Pseudomonadota bacterium]
MGASGSPEGLRLPPHSVEAEQSVLGGLMLDAAAWDQVADRVGAADFYRNDHRLIFEAVAGLIERNQPCDAVTLSGHLESQGLLEQAGGLAYLGALARDTPTAANIRAYADIVRERSILRQLITAGNEIVTSALEPEGREAREIVDGAERAVFEIAERGSRGKEGFRTVKSILPDVVNRIDEMYHSNGKLTGISTGFNKLDDMTSGLQPGDLIIVAGRPSMGKTTLAVNIAENAALGSNKSAAIFSMEMSSESLTLRMISSLGRINQSHLRSGRLQEEDWPRIDSAMAQLSAAKIYVDETPALTPTEVRARARRLKRERGLDLIVVDYLQLMQVSGTKENRATEISEISRSLKALAKELKVPVIALSQLNRGVEQRVEKKPVMSDLRECVAGDTRVWLADGRRVPIRDLVGQTPVVWAMSADRRVIQARSDRVWSKGLRPVWRMAFASGRQITATANHRLFTGGGWQPVSDIGPGECVGLSRKFPPIDDPLGWSDERIAALGQRAAGESLPAEVFRLTDAQIGLLVRHLWARKGRIRPRANGGGARVVFSTDSEALAGDVAALLLRLGIVGRLRQLRQAGARPVYSVDVTGLEQEALFLTRVRSPGQAVIRQSAAMHGARQGARAPHATVVADGRCAVAMDTDMHWDRVVSVRAAGLEEVFDLTVPGPASWLADGIVSHNSGAIEQDADVILLIYREEVYDVNTTRKGIADIIIAKQRNGPTGDVQLTFLGQYTKFENYAPEAYAEGVFRA